MMMLPLTHATLASFSASTTVAAAVVVFSPTGRSACVRKVVAPSGRYRHEPYGARVIPITGAPHIASPPLTFTPYPSVTTIRSKQQQQSSMVISNTNSSGVYSSNESSCSSSSVSTSGHSTANSLSISSNCSRMSEVMDFFMPPVVVAAVVAPTPATSSSLRLPVSAPAIQPVAGKSRAVEEQHSTPAVHRLQHKVKTPEPEKTTTPVAPATAVSSSSDRAKQTSNGSRFAIVSFKYETATFLAPFKLTLGDIVVVEGDRGENIGTVAEIQKDAPSFAVGAKVLRRATEKDLAALKAQREREAAATLSTRAVAESLGLHGRVEDAEYQFDLNKLTIFVSRPTKTTFVDFRKLQRTLFREFRCRIWCSYMDEIEAAEAGPRSR